MNTKDLEFVSGTLGVKILNTAVELAQTFSQYNYARMEPETGELYDRSYGKFWIFGRSIMFLTDKEVLLFNKLGDKRPIVRINLPEDFDSMDSLYDYNKYLIPFGAKICEAYNKNYDKFVK